MTRTLGQPDASPKADTLGARHTIAGIEMLDAIQLEARVSSLQAATRAGSVGTPLNYDMAGGPNR